MKKLCRDSLGVAMAIPRRFIVESTWCADDGHSECAVIHCGAVSEARSKKVRAEIQRALDHWEINKRRIQRMKRRTK